MSLEERIWIENIRWDTIKSESFSGSDAEMAIQSLWSITEDNHENHSFNCIKPNDELIPITITLECANKLRSLAAGIQIDEERGYLTLLDEDGFVFSGINIVNKYVVINHMRADVPNCPNIQVDVQIAVFDVPYDVTIRSIVNYPLCWPIPVSNSTDAIMIALSPNDPPKAMVMIEKKYCPVVGDCLTTLYTYHCNRHTKSPYGIIANAIVMIDPNMRSKESLLGTVNSMIARKPYLINRLSDTPYAQGIVELVPIQNGNNEIISMHFDEFFYAYRGVLSTRVAVIDKAALSVVIDGVRIERPLTKELSTIINELWGLSIEVDGQCNSDNIDAIISNSPAVDTIKNYLCQFYVKKKMIDQIVIIDKLRGTLICDLTGSKDKKLPNIEEDL